MGLISLTVDNFDAEVGSGIALVDFWAEWCRPCKMLGPIIGELAEENEGNAKICSVNVDNDKPLARRFAVMSIPTVIIFKDGVEVNRIVGVKAKEEYESALNI